MRISARFPVGSQLAGEAIWHRLLESISALSEAAISMIMGMGRYSTSCRFHRTLPHRTTALTGLSRTHHFGWVRSLFDEPWPLRVPVSRCWFAPASSRGLVGMTGCLRIAHQPAWRNLLSECRSFGAGSIHVLRRPQDIAGSYGRTGHRCRPGWRGYRHVVAAWKKREITKPLRHGPAEPKITTFASGHKRRKTGIFPDAKI